MKYKLIIYKFISRYFYFKKTEKINSIKLLIFISDKFNKGWIPDWSNPKEYKYYFSISGNKQIRILSTMHENKSVVYFKSYEIAMTALKLLGKKAIEKSLN